MSRPSSVGGLLGAICLSLTLATRGQPQTATERSARAAADTFFALVTREKWDSASAMLDLAGFEPYLKGVVRNARSAIPQRPMTAEYLMSIDSTMPRAVAEWQIQRMKRSDAGDQFSFLSTQFAGVTSPSDLFALSAPAAAARWLEAQDERFQMREAWRRQGCPMSELPSFPAVKRVVRAVGIANDSTAYVVQTDDRFGESPPDNLSFGERVMEVRRVGGRWLIVPRADLLQPRNFGYGFDCARAKRP